MIWTPDMDAVLRDAHGVIPLAEIAERIGTTKPSVRARITRLGIAKKAYWSEADVSALRALYEAAGADGVLRLSEFAVSIGKDKANVCRKAKELGLATNAKRKNVEQRKDRRKFQTAEELSAHLSAEAKRRIAENGHPRGMLGKRHKPEVLALISKQSTDRWAAMSDEERLAHTNKAIETRMRAGFTRIPGGGRGTWKAGWREIGGKRNYYRSRWEANYARYLQWLKDRNVISDWAHEPETFWFEQIKRGVRSYLPDFRVWELDGSSSLHEVKGWMCSRSKTTLSRMAKYHPDQKIILIDGKQYRAIRLKVMHLIPEWEDAARDGHA